MAKDILDIAAAIKDLYGKIYEESDDLTEMKMHKLLYFAQKVHFRNFGEWLFEEDFEGWQHGPVNKKVRYAFESLKDSQEELTSNEEYSIRETIFDYGQYSAGVLRKMSHEDSSYQKSREGLKENDPGFEVILKENIMHDLPEYTEEDFEEFEVK